MTPAIELIIECIPEHTCECYNTEGNGAPNNTPEGSLVLPGEDVADELPDASEEDGEPHAESDFCFH